MPIFIKFIRFSTVIIMHNLSVNKNVILYSHLSYNYAPDMAIWVKIFLGLLSMNFLGCN